MSSTKNKRSILNILFSTAGQVVVLLCGIVVPKLFVDTFGSEVNGFVSSVSQIFVYIGLLEAGVGTATLTALYRPVAEDDRDSINGILSATNMFYRRTGIIYFALVMVAAAVYPLVVESEIPYWTAFAFIALHGLAGVLTYFLQGKYRLLLDAEGKHYIHSAVATIVQVVTSLSKVLVVLLGGDIVVLQIVYLVISAGQAAFYMQYILRHYKWINLKVTPDTKSIEQKNSVFVQQISQLVFNNTDILVLTFFCDLKVVSVYTLLNTFFEMVSTLIGNVNTGFSFRMGQLFNTDKKEYLHVYEAYETYYTTISFALYTICFIFMSPFLKLYTSSFKDAESYLLPLMPLLFAMIKILVSGRAPSGFTISYAGHFKQNRVPAIIESVINLTVSIAAVLIWGIYGVLLGTIAALLYRANQMVIYNNTKILERSPWKTYKTWLMCVLLFIGFYFLNKVICVDMSNYFLLIMWAVVYGIVIMGTFLVVASIFHKEAFTVVRGYIKRILASLKKSKEVH